MAGAQEADATDPLRSELDEPEVVDVAAGRVHRPLDLVRLGALLLLLVFVGVVATIGHDTIEGANDDVTRLLTHVPKVLVHALSTFGTFGALVLLITFTLREVVRGHARRLVEALVTGLIAIGLVGLLDTAISSDDTTSLHHVMTHVGTSTAVRPLDAYLAALFAFVVVVGLAEPLWRTMFWTLSGVYVVSAFAAAQASLLSLLASPAIGVLVAVILRYTAGSTNVRPDARRIAEEVSRRGFDVLRIERVPSISGEHRSYVAHTDRGQALRLQVFDRDLIASGAVYNVYRRLRLRAEVALPPALSLERVAARRALLALTAQAAGVRVTQFLAGIPCGAQTVVLIYEEIPLAVVETPSDAQLGELWDNVIRLHRSRVTHRGLTAERVLSTPDGRVMLPILRDGETFASDLRIRLDRAQVLVTTAQLVGPQRAVAVAREHNSDEDLADSLPLLQPVALSRETRTALRRDSDMLAALREQIEGQTDQVVPEPIRVERFRPRTVVSIVALIVAGYLLVGQLGSVDLASVFSAARWGWVPLVLLASAGTYVAAALSLTGFVRERLSFTRTLIVQVAASFVGFVTPPSVGGLAINLRYLRASRISAAGAATSVGMCQVVNALLHAVLLVVFAAATGASSHTSLPIPGWVFVAVGLLAGLALLLLTVPGPRRWALARLLPPLREALPRLLDLVIKPVKLAEALLGALLLNGFYIAALWLAMRAFGGGLGFATVAVVYLAGAAVASVAPTPGGLGAVEVTLSTGLAAAGMPSAAAVSAVLLFRVATFWLPVPAGWIALHILQRQHAV